MSKASERTLLLLQELALLKEERKKGHLQAGTGQKRQKEIREEIKQIATEKKEQAT
jgi:hypothetical protein